MLVRKATTVSDSFFPMMVGWSPEIRVSATSISERSFFSCPAPPKSTLPPPGIKADRDVNKIRLARVWIYLSLASVPNFKSDCYTSSACSEFSTKIKSSMSSCLVIPAETIAETSFVITLM